ELDIGPTELARGGIGRDRLAHADTRRDDVTAGVPKLLDRAGEILLAGLVRRFGGIGKSERLRFVARGLEHLLTEVLRIIHRADLLGAGFLRQMPDARPELVVVG